MGIIKNGCPLPVNVQSSNGGLNIFFHESQFIPVLDTRRNERPVYVMFNPDLKWASIGKGHEPVGEQEPTAGS